MIVSTLPLDLIDPKVSRIREHRMQNVSFTTNNSRIRQMIFRIRESEASRKRLLTHPYDARVFRRASARIPPKPETRNYVLPTFAPQSNASMFRTNPEP